jgi:hypothetical protein
MRGVLVLFALSGCSLMHVRGPDAGAMECTASYTAPTVDFVGAFTLGSLPLVAIAAGANDFGSVNTSTKVILGSLIGGALLTGTSGVIGFYRVGDCRKRRAGLTDEFISTWFLQLRDRASAAAHAGDCDTVDDLADKARSVDSARYETVFMRDAAVAHCVHVVRDREGR